MMRDPLDMMHRICEWAGDDLTPATAERMHSWLTEHPQTRLGQNSYSLDQYGLFVDELKLVFAEYLGQFDIELEGIDG